MNYEKGARIELIKPHKLEDGTIIPPKTTGVIKKRHQDGQRWIVDLDSGHRHVAVPDTHVGAVLGE
jgi:hypothetical protein